MSHSIIPSAADNPNASHAHELDGTRQLSPQDTTQVDVAAAMQMQDLQNQMLSASMDPYVCGGFNRPGFLEFIYPFCDWTFFLMILMFFGSVIGLGIVLGDFKRDNMFKMFDVDNTAELESLIAPLISVNLSSCTHLYLFGSFGSLCMEKAMNASTFVLQLSVWNNARGALWCLAAFFSAVALLFAIVIHVQRHPTGLQPDFLTPEKQMELLRMTPEQQRLYFFQLQQTMAQQSSGCCGGVGVEVYDTPYYAFLRVAWGFTGIACFVWIATTLVSFWSFMGFYVDHSEGDLKNFFEVYSVKYTATILTVGVFLTWPILCILLELAIWVVGFLPWLLIRSTLKPGIERFRPSLPLSKIPGYIRCDMFFMDFQDIKRFGFSRLQWMLLTENERPFFDCFEDPTLIRDPDMMNAMLGGPLFNLPGAVKAETLPPEGQGSVQETERKRHSRKGEDKDRDEGPSSSKRRKKSKSHGESKSRKHRRSHKDPEDSAAEGGAPAKKRKHRGGSSGHRHRSRSRSAVDDRDDKKRHSSKRHGSGEGESRRHRSRKNTEEKNPPPGQTELDALMQL